MGGMVTVYCAWYARKPTAKKKNNTNATRKHKPRPPQTSEAASTVLTTMHRIIIRCELIPFPSVPSLPPPPAIPWPSCRSFPLHNFAYFAFGSYVSCNVYILFHFNILLKDGWWFGDCCCCGFVMLAPCPFVCVACTAHECIYPYTRISYKWHSVDTRIMKLLFLSHKKPIHHSSFQLKKKMTFSRPKRITTNEFWTRKLTRHTHSLTCTHYCVSNRKVLHSDA